MASDEDDCTLFCGNISDKVTENTLYELFLQAGPLDRVRIPKDNNTGNKKSFAFVTFKHSVSVPYTVELMNGIHLYGKPLKLNFKSGSIHERNKQAHFNRSMSAPTMHQFDMSNLGASPPFHGAPSMVRNQSYGPGLNSLSNPNDFSDNRSRYDRNVNDWQKDRGSSERSRQRDSDYSGRYNDGGRKSDYDRSRSRDDRDRRRDYEDQGRQRSYDRDRDRHDRDRHSSRQDSQDRNSRKGYDTPPHRGYDTPPHPSRQSSFDTSPSGFPIMNPDPQRDILATRQAVMALQQQQLMLQGQIRNQQNQSGAWHGNRGNRRPGRW